MVQFCCVLCFCCWASVVLLTSVRVDAIFEVFVDSVCSFLLFLSLGGLGMVEDMVVGFSDLRFAVVNVKSNIVLSCHRSVNGANVEAAEYNKALNFDDSDLFKVVELSGSVVYKVD